MQLSQPGDVPVWTLTDRLRKAREHASLSQAELADLIGISRASVSGYEAGYRPPPKPVLMVWAMVCHVDLGWLSGAPGGFPGQEIMILPVRKRETCTPTRVLAGMAA